MALLMSALIASLSRSILLAMAVGFAVVAIVQLVTRKFDIKAWAMLAWRFVLAIALGILLLGATVEFPFPSQKGNIDLGSLLKDRYSSLNDPAVGARWALLTPLWGAITENPLMGYGFAKSLSYESPDPFWKNIDPSGLVTTTRFEWGWLDVWLKFGIVGGIFFIGYLAALGRKLRGAELGAFIVLLATHATTPYLDHPIGLGILLALEVYVAAEMHRSANYLVER
jgi:O-antigen ligase